MRYAPFMFVLLFAAVGCSDSPSDGSNDEAGSFAASAEECAQEAQDLRRLSCYDDMVQEAGLADVETVRGPAAGQVYIADNGGGQIEIDSTGACAPLKEEYTMQMEIVGRAARRAGMDERQRLRMISSRAPSPLLMPSDTAATDCVAYRSEESIRGRGRMTFMRVEPTAKLKSNFRRVK